MMRKFLKELFALDRVQVILLLSSLVLIAIVYLLGGKQ